MRRKERFISKLWKFFIIVLLAVFSVIVFNVVLNVINPCGLFDEITADMIILNVIFFWLYLFFYYAIYDYLDYLIKDLIKKIKDEVKWWNKIDIKLIKPKGAFGIFRMLLLNIFSLSSFSWIESVANQFCVHLETQKIQIKLVLNSKISRNV